MSRSAIIVAGGSGTRMGSATPKQFLLVNAYPILAHTLRAFRKADESMKIVLVLPAAQIDSWHALTTKHNISIELTVVEGGPERADSVQRGLAKVRDSDLVAVHDGVRPLVSVGLIQRCFEAAEQYGAAIPVVPISSSIRSVNENGNKAEDRSRLRAVQTPQCFRTRLLVSAFEAHPELRGTDEASLVEKAGHSIHLVQGEDQNIKITTPLDLKLAEILLA